MSHPFGDLLSQHLHRKHGLSQSKLAEGILQDPSIIGKMCKGQRLNGPQARERVLAIIDWLHRQAVMTSVPDANQLLTAAGMAPLRESEPAERALLRQLHGQALPSVASSLSSPVTPTRKTNLPAPLTSFVGRTQEMAEVTQSITTQRLVTLTGAGGVGKTRLALEMAKALYDFGFTNGKAAETNPRQSEIVNRQFPDGVWWVELAALAQPELVAQTIARLFKQPEQTGRASLDRLQEYLADKQLLLILDNCEHVVDACAALVERLLQHCWQLHILTTSREELRIPGEMIYAVLPLALPNPAERMPERVLASAAVQLFVERMGVTLPKLNLQGEDATIVAHICHQLDGIPLALELAAPLMRSMSLIEIATQLDNQMALLTNNYRTAIPRHQTMHSALVWSYRLLAQDEQQLLARVSVFIGGWTLDAVQALCSDASSPTITTANVVALLNQLIAKSLVLVETQNGERRYRLLEPVRQFAQAQLAASGEQEVLRRRHACYFLGLAEKMDQARDTLQEREWLQTLEPERNNLWAVNRWAFEHNEAEFAQRFNGFLCAFWIYCSSISEARHWLEGSLALKVAENQAERTSLALMAEVAALNTAGHAAALMYDFTNAQTLFERELKLCTELDDLRGIATSLRGISYTLMLSNNLSEAQPYGEQALAICHAAHDHWGIAWSLFDLGYLALVGGDLTVAQALLEEALPKFQEQGINYGACRALLALGHVMRAAVNNEQARRFYVDALRLQQQMHYVQHIADGLEGIAAIAVAQHDPMRAVRLFGAAHAHRQSIAMTRPYHQETGYERDVAFAHSQLSQSAWDANWAAGCALTLEQAVEYALGV